MTLTLPTDGFGIYESIVPGDPTAFQRLDKIASSGFNLVMNYGLLYGHATDVTNYINRAASNGIKVIVALHHPNIWLNNTIGATFPELSSDAGSTTDNGFTTYVVNLTKVLSGTWGYYSGDEVTNANHAALKTHTDYIHAADPVKPRLYIAGGNGKNAVATGTSPFYDCCEVWGDDYYGLGPPSNIIYAQTLAQQAAGIQTNCTLQGKDSAIVLQAHSWSAYPPFPPSTYPTNAQMLQFRSDALNNMTPRVVLWYSCFDIINQFSPDFAPNVQWKFLVDAIKGNVTVFPSWFLKL